MKTTSNSFFILFCVIVTLELLSGLGVFLSDYHSYLKPAIVGSLIIYLVLNWNHLVSAIKYLTLCALVFSLTGDILLLFAAHSDLYFIFGLVAFLCAHIFYAITFLKRRVQKFKFSVVILLILSYAIGIVYFLKDGLGELLLPVICYVVIITLMAISALLRKGIQPNSSYLWVLAGAILFLISDSFLAINKFHTKLPLEHLLIMLTYAFAQFAIVRGILLQKE
ncbi:MAG: lysoplasmalogenase [bacterium]